MNFSYRGLMAPVFTPFKENMVLNLDIIEQYAIFLNNSGIKGVLVNGSTGEGPSLSLNERKLVVEKWKESVAKTKQHLMVQIGGTALPDVIDLARHAEEIGADSLLCLPDLYFKPRSCTELIDYLKPIGAAASKTPLLYYHYPASTNVNVNMGQFLNEIVGKVPTFCGIKFTSTCLSEGFKAIHANQGKYAVFLGADDIFAAALSIGFNSAIATSLNILPHLSIEIKKATEELRIKEAYNAQKTLNTAIEAITADGPWVPTMKHAMNILTPIKVGPVRRPLHNLSDENIKKMKAELQHLHLK